MKGRTIRRVLQWALAIAFLGAVLWELAVSHGGMELLASLTGIALRPPPVTEAEPVAAQTGESATAPVVTLDALPPYLGDVTEQDGYVLSAVAVQDPATPSILANVDRDHKMVGVEVIIGNASSETFSVNPMRATLLDSDGLGYEATLGGSTAQQIGAVYLVPGAKARGWITYEIPETVTPAGIRYAFGADGERVLTTGLAPSPPGHAPDLAPLAILPTPPETPLGEALEQEGYSLRAAAVSDPAPTGLLHDVPGGYKLVGAEIVVTNVSGSLLDASPRYAMLVDSEGYMYEAELGGRASELEVASLEPGEQARGWVAFVIPESVVPASLKYAYGPFSYQLLHVGLTP